MTPVFIDFETYWSTTHTLTRMSATEYVMHPDTEIISCAIKFGSNPTDVLFGEETIAKAFKRIDWSNKMVVGHNMSGFDALILAWRFGVKPKMYACTAAMARPKYSKTGVNVGGKFLTGVSLKKLAAELRVGKKLDLEATNTKGKYLADFTTQELRQMEEYNKIDTELCYELFRKLYPQTLPQEMLLIDMTTRMLVEPQFVLDQSLVRGALNDVREEKTRSLLDLANLLGIDGYANTALLDGTPVEEQVRTQLASAAKFGQILKDRGVPTPMKTSKTTGKLTPALAKTDDEFIALQDHDDPLVAAAARARLEVKSTLLETRLQAFLRAAAVSGGLLPMPLKYAGADTTGRWSGEQYNPQNLPRITPGKAKVSDALRMSLMAPKGHKVIVADLSGIELRVNHFLWQVPSSMALFRADPEKADLYKHFAASLYNKTEDEVEKAERQVGKVCLAEGTLVLTDSGPKPIESVSVSDLLWDGVEWVTHDGPIYAGEKETITYDGIEATPDHEVWVEDGRKIQLRDAAAQSLKLARTGAGWTPLGFGGAGVCGQYVAAADGSGAYGRANSDPVPPTVVQAKRRVWDILNAGPRNRFTANDRLVSNCHLGLGFGAGAVTFKTVAKLMAGIDLDDAEATNIVNAWRGEYVHIVEGWRRFQQCLPAIKQGTSEVLDPWGLCVTEHNAIRLPSGRRIQYPDLEMVRDNGKTEWWYGNGRTKARIYGGKGVENCIAEGTLVLTDKGWKPIESVSLGDLVHDGVEFVRHDGIVFKSVQPCVTVDGVLMTPDHEVLTDEGWKEASQVQRPFRPYVWHAYRTEPGSVHGEEVAMAVQMPVRRAGCEAGVGCDEGGAPRRDSELRVRDGGADVKGPVSPRDVKTSGVRRVAFDAGSLQAADAPVMEKLRRAGYSGVRAVANVIRKLLGRHGGGVPARAGLGPSGQQRAVLAGELPVGTAQNEHDEQAEQCDVGGHPRVERGDWDQQEHAVQQAQSRMAAGGLDETTLPRKPVYDIVNCGPRHRFVVSGTKGPFIVHNCVQALARDVIAEHAVEFFKATGLRPALTVHDELVYVVPDANAEELLQQLQGIMRSGVSWWPELITWSEGDIADRYGDAK